MKPVTSVPLDKNVEDRFLQFLNQDKIRHFYAIYDLSQLRDKTLAWIALTNNRVVGYLIEYDKRILYMRGQATCAAPLLRNSDLTNALLNIEPQHLSAVNSLYEPTEPADKTTKGLVTTFTPMKTTPENFKPIIQHDMEELKKENANELAVLLGTDPQQALNLLKGFAFGILKDSKLVSYAASPDMLEDLAIVRGVYTIPEERNKGYSTSVCSALVQRLHQEGKDAFLYVSKDNTAAIKLYRKIGFKETGHVFLGFTAKRKRATST